jgi:Ser/Thr protein kinase RdoA (MazF antagonist)
MGRNDHGLHNLLVDPETGDITAMLDWGYTLVVPAAFDFEFAVYLYSGAFLAGLTDVSDHRSFVRDEMLAGYRSTADRPEAVAESQPLYEMLAMVRIMNDFHHLDLPEGSEDAVIERIRADVRAVLDA